MKNTIVRARIDADLKKQATAVLEGNALGMSAAIRIFLQHVVRRGGLPFAVRDPGVRAVPGKQLRAMKRASQVRDLALAMRENVPPEAMLLLRPERLRGARIEWPERKAYAQQQQRRAKSKKKL
jgi:DNA-damage-inducible protein J